MSLEEWKKRIENLKTKENYEDKVTNASSFCNSCSAMPVYLAQQTDDLKVKTRQTKVLA